MEDLVIVDNPNKGKKIGQFKSEGNLTFMRLYNGGHMIPFDQPEGGVRGKCFYTGKPATCEAIFARAY